MSAQGPFGLEDFLAAVVEALKIRGDARAITALLEGDCHFDFCESDFGVDFWNLFIALPVHIFYAMTDAERNATSDVIFEVGSPFFGSTPSDGLRRVIITPKVVPAPEHWRSEAVRFVRGEGVTNQDEMADAAVRDLIQFMARRKEAR